MFLFFSLLSRLYYRGNFSSFQIKSKFPFFLEIFLRNSTLSPFPELTANLAFSSNIMEDQAQKPHSLIGLSYNRGRNYVLVGSWAEDANEVAWIYSFLKNSLNTSRIEPKVIHNNLTKYYPVDHISYRFFSIFFSISSNNSITSPFYLPQEINGILLGGTFLFDIHGFSFNAKQYWAEYRIYGVFLGFLVISSFYAWHSLDVYISNNINSFSISLLTLEIIISNDFFVLTYLISILKQKNFIALPYSFHIFLIFSLFLQLLYELYVMYKIYIKNYSYIEGTNNQRNSCTVTYDLYVYVYFFFFICIYFFFFPTFQVFLSLCAFTFQLISNILNKESRICVPFIRSIFINSILSLLYRYLYVNNVFCTYSTKFVKIGLLLVLIQIIFFSILKFINRFTCINTYVYQSLASSGDQCAICQLDFVEGEEIVKTPCDHSFHNVCLSRWMEEKMTCPICRQSLPPITEL